MFKPLIATFVTAAIATSALLAADADKPAAKPAAEPVAAADAPVKDISHIIGANIGANMKRDGVEIDADSLLAGIKEALSGSKPKFSPEEAQKLMQSFQEKLMATRAQADAEKGAAAKEEGTKFLAANGKREGVTTTASGLQYQVIKKGDGAMPKSTDEVKVHYHGTLVDGKVFDSSVDRGEPAQFPVGGVIKGWVEALQLMPTGSKWKIFIPSDLAYGEAGAGGDIPPHSALIFEVELLEIVKK